MESAHHADDGSQETHHRGNGGDGGQRGDPLFQTGDFQIALVFDSRADIFQRTTETGKTLVDHAGGGVIVAATQRDGRVQLALVDEIANIVHEVTLLLGGTVDYHQLLDKEIDGESQHQDQRDDNPQTVDCKNQFEIGSLLHMRFSSGGNNTHRIIHNRQ